MSQRDQRRKFYQKRVALYKSIFSFFIFAGLGIALLAIFYTIFSANFVGYLLDRYNLGSSSGAVLLLSQIIGNQWFYIILGGFLLVGLSTFFTHRFAGPLYRFEMSLDRMISRDFSFKITLRKNDECKNLAQKMNVFNGKIASTLKTMMFLAEEMEKNHRKLQNGVQGRDFEILMETANLNKRLKTMLSGFKYE